MGDKRTEDYEEHRARLMRGCSPRALHAARRSTHQAAQLIADAARANLAPEEDYGHISLDWREAGLNFSWLASRPFAGGPQIALALSPPQLNWLAPDGGQFGFPLEDHPVDAARSWLDGLLATRGLKPATAVAPDQIARFEAAEPVAFAALDGWFSLAADALADFAAAHGDIAPGPSPVRCWPHHFDIATYVALEEGDPETAKGVGVGLSPGDEHYDQPYLYVTPFPAPGADAPPPAPEPGAWRTEGFTGIIATGEAILAADMTERAQLAAYLAGAFAAARRSIGA